LERPYRISVSEASPAFVDWSRVQRMPFSNWREWAGTRIGPVATDGRSVPMGVASGCWALQQKEQRMSTKTAKTELNRQEEGSGIFQSIVTPVTYLGSLSKCEE
jgi:hypothetical protein